MTTSKELTDIAFRAQNGELAWKRNDIPFVIEELKKINIGVQHGEVWLIEANGRWTGLIPKKKSLIKDNIETGIYHWEVENKIDERWDEYLNRSIAETLTAISALNPEDDIEESLKDRIFYNLHLLEEKDFQK